MTKIKNEKFALDQLRVPSTLNRVSRRSRIRTSARSYLLNFRNITIAICFVFLAVSAQAQTPDVDKNWTTLGSAGTLDETSVGKVFFDLHRSYVDRQHYRRTHGGRNPDDSDR